MIIKKICRLAIILMALLYISACSSDTTNNKLADAKTGIDKVLDEQVKKSEKDDADKKSSANPSNSSDKKTNEDTNEENLDYDLTTMSNEMVYATVFDIVSYPENYIGKKIKIPGLYYVATNENVQKNYHYVMITDATTCCSQGIEFVWEDGSHVYPDEYPEEGTVIVVVGIFESYVDEDDGMTYLRLNDSSMKVIN
jgi:hypothetical protein